MSTPTVPQNAQPSAPAENRGRALTILSYLAIPAYIPWFIVMFAGGYWVYSWFDLDPSQGDSLTSQGILGWLTAIVFILVATLPSWIGAWLAVRARRAGAQRPAGIALGLNLLIGLAYGAFMLIPGTV